MGFIGFIAMIVLGIVQLALGFAGLEYLLGWWAGFVGLVAALGFRIMLPMTVGTYFGAVSVLGWPWWAGVLITLPGLIFLVPGIIHSIVYGMKNRQ